MDGVYRGVFIFILYGYYCNVNATVSVYTIPREVLLPVKSTVTVDCIPTPKKGVRIIWKKNNKEIALLPAFGPKPGDSYVLSNNSLYIKSLKRRTTGTYTCIAILNAERQTADVVVTVSYLQRLEPIAPVKVFRGSDAEIKCQKPLGKPPPLLSWKKNGKSIINTRYIFPLDTDKFWTLNIKDVKKSDVGNYTCLAKNKAKIRNTTTTLEVVIPGRVDVSPKQVSIHEGQAASFKCVSKSEPPLQVMWKKISRDCSERHSKVVCKILEKKVIPDQYISVSNGKFIVKNALPKHKGTYTCIAALGSEFDSSNVTLNILELIKIDKFLHQNVQNLDRRKKHTKISCRFRGDGLFKVTWSKGNGVKAQKLPSNMVARNTTLSITNLKFEDAGNYTCTAKGRFNSKSAHVEVVVYESPQFTMRPANVTGYVGDSVWIHCQGEGKPTPKVSYAKEKKKGDSINATHFVQLPNNTLYIKELKKEDNGPYFCLLGIKYTNNSTSFHITVKDPIRKTESGTPMARTVGIAVGCAGVYILLVIGLMIYCRARRARLLKEGIIIESGDGECLKDPLVGNEAIPLENGKCLDQWQFSRDDLKDLVILGRGKMGRVYKAKAYTSTLDEETETLVAVKEFDNKDHDLRTDFDLEVEMFAQLNHVNVVSLIGVTTDAQPFYIITDYSELGDLKQYLTNTKNISNTIRVHMTLCIAKGMDYLIKLHYIHRDLAARNCIPFLDNNVKVSFLSICEDLYHHDYYLLNNIPVPLRWLSPEAIQSETYTEKSDVWSFGVTMWEIFAGGEGPYAAHKNEKVLDGVCKELRLQMPTGCPPDVFDVMTKCWLKDATARPTFDELTSLIADIKIDK